MQTKKQTDFCGLLCVKTFSTNTERSAIFLQSLSFCAYFIRADDSIDGDGLCSVNGVRNVCECDQLLCP